MMDIEQIAIEPEAVFGFPVAWEILGFHERSEHVPKADHSFHFVREATQAILMGFAANRRVYLHGPHGSGKSSHIEQVAARLNWPCLRVNLDSHITRADLIGRDMILLRDGKQVTEFVPGILVWALEHPVALVLDEYDAGRPDVMFVIQRVLESEGQFTLLDQNRVIKPHPYFRIFATANTAGQGDASGMYAGTQALNQAQLDRWQVVGELSYLPPEAERKVLMSRVIGLDPAQAEGMVHLAGLARAAFRQGDLSSLMSFRTLITWAENAVMIGDYPAAFRLAFLNRCDVTERPLLRELFQRCFAVELGASDIDDGLF